MKFKTIGIIVNPAAGADSESKKETFNKLAAKLKQYQLLIAPGSMGKEYLSKLSSNHKVIGGQKYFDHRDTISIAQKMAAAGADLLIGIGGDGALADISYGIYQIKNDVPIVGIGVGSTNAGSLIRFKAAELDKFNPQDLKEESLNCVLAFYQDRLVGLGFNDCVIGTTIVGTLDGKQADLDAAQRIQGRKVEAKSQSIGTEETKVLKNGQAMITGKNQEIGQIIAAPVDNRYLGKAVSGLLCWSSFLNYGAALAAVSFPVVQVNVDKKVLDQTEPFNLSQLLFDEEDSIELRGIKPGAVLCLDGNPHLVLKKDDIIKIRFKRNAVGTLV